MAIKLYGTLSQVVFIGDGTSTSAELDLRQLIPVVGFAQGVFPESVLSFAASPPLVSSVTLNGKTLTVNFSSAPTTDQLVGLQVNFRFTAT